MWVDLFWTAKRKKKSKTPSKLRTGKDYFSASCASKINCKTKQNKKTKLRKDIKNATKTREQHSSSPPLFCFFLQILTKEIEMQILESKGI